MANFFAELKRRHIYRVAAAYVVVAWVLLQLFNNLDPILKLPDWAGTFVLVLLAGGFPVAILLAWVRELAPVDGTTAGAVTSKLDWALIGVVVVLIAMSGYQELAPSRNAAIQGQQVSVESARIAAAKPTGISVAVLPFVNLSSDKEQEFFSDGMTEEITAALAKVPDLKVVARTSAFEFKGKNVDVEKIGAQLHATHLIEGSVRKAGDKLRITAQLIKADDGTHLWAEDYDRQLTDIFQIQEDIARAIATSLRMPLGLKPGQNLVSSRNINPEIYQEFLRIRAKQQAFSTNATRLEVIEELEKLLARAPNFAKAWASLSSVYLLEKSIPLYEAPIEPSKETRQQLLPAYDKAAKAAREAIRLDETEVLAYAILAQVEYYRNNWVAAEDLLRKGLNFDPYDPDILAIQAGFLYKTGRIKQALPVWQEIHDLEPLSSVQNYYLALGYVANNQPDAAIALLEGRTQNAIDSMSMLASAYAMKGQFDKAADVVLAVGRGLRGRRWGQATVEDAGRLLRNAPRKVTDPKALPPLHEHLNFIYGYVGAEDRLLDFSERSFDAGMFGEVRYLFTPIYSSARKTERFKTLVRKAGLVDYWRARGWPDLCHPTTGDAFACE